MIRKLKGKFWLFYTFLIGLIILFSFLFFDKEFKEKKYINIKYNNKMLYRCEICGFETSLKGNLSKHLKTRKHSFNLKGKMEMNQNEPKTVHLAHREKSKKNANEPNEPKLAHLAHRGKSKKNEPNEPILAHFKSNKKNEPNEPKLVHPKKNKINNKNLIQSPDSRNSEFNLISPLDQELKDQINSQLNSLTCQYCLKEFKSKPSKRRHELHRCKNKNSESVELIDELKKQTQLVQQLLEEKATHFEAVLNEKEKYIDILRDKMSSTTNHNTFNIIRNNIYTMKPLQFLNTFCINNPSLEQVVNCIQDSDLSDEEVNRIKEASHLDAKHVIAKEFDSILKKHNQELIQDKPLTCGNVVFSNDGSNRRFIAKGNQEWQFYSSDEKLDTSTQVILSKVNENIDKPVHMTKKDRGMIHRHLKNMNDFNKSRDALLNALEGKDPDLLQHLTGESTNNLSIESKDNTIQHIDDTNTQLETLIETYADYKSSDKEDEIEVEIEYEIESGHEGEQELEEHHYPVYDNRNEYGIILDCGSEHYYDEDNNVFNKQTKKYIGVRVHDDECDCENVEECWYYVKYLNEL